MIGAEANHVIYENPRPHVHSRHGYFPGLTRLPSGELLCLFMLAEAFEAPDGTTWITRSGDGGRTWTPQGPLHAKPALGFETTDVMKATLLRDGSLLAMGYRFHRRDPEEGIGIASTGGIQPGDDILSRSRDGGRAWDEPRVMPRTRPELLEISGPCVETASGDLVAVAAPYKMPDGSNPSGQTGVLLRSRDGGATWDDRAEFFRSAQGNLTPLESRVIELEPGHLAVLSWAYDYAADRHYPNHLTYSADNGYTWAAPLDTGVTAQASGITPLGGTLAATIHAHRAGDDPGLWIRIVDLAGGRWRVIEEQCVWRARPSRTSGADQPMTEMFTSLRFGQPSLTRVDGNEYLAAFWSIEDGQGRIRALRARISV